MVQPFAGVGVDHSWIMCALWGGYPTVVAKPVWDALRRASPGPPGDEFTTLGFPDIDAIVPADAERVKLRGGAWGQGLLLRDSEVGTWHWQPEPRIRFVSMKKWLGIRPPPPPLRARVEAHIPWARSSLSITSQTHGDLASKLAVSDLARSVTTLLHGSHPLALEHWKDGSLRQTKHDDSLICTIVAPDGSPVLAVEVMLKLDNRADFTDLTAAAELRIEDVEAWRNVRCHVDGSQPKDSEARLSLDDLRGFFAAAWEFVVNIVPAAVAGDMSAIAYVGPPKIDLLISAATPMDLLRGGWMRTRQKLKPGDRTKLAAVILLDGPGKWFKQGDLNAFVNFSPFELASRKSRITEMSARIVAPLQLNSGDRQRLTREALAFMIPEKRLKTSDPEWSDTITAALHTAFRP